jgi:hypothetical protein
MMPPLATPRQLATRIEVARTPDAEPSARWQVVDTNGTRARRPVGPRARGLPFRAADLQPSRDRYWSARSPGIKR